MGRCVAVIDIGKTNAKVALVDLGEMREVAVRTTPNQVRHDGPYPHFDIEGIRHFILDSLTALNREHGVDAITVTTHGATAVLLDAQGQLALPVLDYEHIGPDTLAAQYDAVRPLFAETGTPRLPIGLNLGAQIFWQAQSFPDEFARVASIVMYPQYWAYRLCGVLANEATSLGCHTDLWNPSAGDYSSLVDRQGWRKLMAPVRLASERLGAIGADVAAATGIATGTSVHCGIHDSNASLLPHLQSRKPPFSVASTGTWVISMAVGARRIDLDPARDTLINVNALGDPVPSARFMGGREFETLMSGMAAEWTEADVAVVLDRRMMLLPSVQQGSGPFPALVSSWPAGEPNSAGERSVTVSFYLAMMTATCLELIGGDGPTVVEGPFAKNRLFLRMLAAATGRPVVTEGKASTGTSLGAALLAAAPTSASSDHHDEKIVVSEAAWLRYSTSWKMRIVDAVGQGL